MIDAKEMLCRLGNGSEATARDVGGKALGLMRMHGAGLPVPPGEVLTCKFFEPWCDALSRSASHLDPRATVHSLTLDDGRRALLDGLLERLRGEPGALFAVRSSAVDEDAAGHSFAGVFRSVLKVPAAGVETAIRDCLASGFAPSVAAYRRTFGLPATPTRMAVIVQRQIAADVAGVAFSIDPSSNDHDEARIAAAPGLGETVVDGKVVVDEYVVERRSGRCISGNADGHGVLDAGRIAAITAVLAPIEQLVGGPVDVEWAFAGGALHLLQARPITTWVPLPEALMTGPDEPRRLYLDAALSKGMTTNSAFSPLGLAQVERAFGGLLAHWLGATPTRPLSHRLIAFAGGRMYLNLSDLLRMTSPAQLARGHAATDQLSAAIIAAADAQRYRARHLPTWLRADLLWRIPRALWRLRGLPAFLLHAAADPGAAHRRYVQVTEQVTATLKGLLTDERSPGDLQAEITRCMAPAFDVLMGAMLLGLLRPIGALDSARRAALGSGSGGNVAIDMNIALQRLAKRMGQGDCADPATLAERLRTRQLDDTLLAEWDAFVDRFGWRGPGEMDVAAGRYADTPELVVEQLLALRDAPDLEAAHQRLAAARERVLQSLGSGAGPLRRRLLVRIATLLRLFGGARDTPKHLNVLANQVIRTRALRAGLALQEAGRLADANEVFDLTLADVDAALDDPSRDVRAAREANLPFLRLVRRHVRCFPPVIDSRGRILRPSPGAAGDAVLHGMGVSPGRAEGRVRILHSPRGASIDDGAVLVGYTTDPGWTPLFAKASAILLEVGGTLQHGAVVAREFGKPCIVAIPGVTTRLRDGQRVHVDADAGSVRLLDD